MARYRAEWDPAWDDDCQPVEGEPEPMGSDEHLTDMQSALQYYRYGYRHPMNEWSNVEADLYQEYMSGLQEQPPNEDEQASWDKIREWAHRGWESARFDEAA
jgi:hypothetical protein